MSNNSSYDKALLDEAPEITPQQRQRFYDADLLYDDNDRRQGADGTPAPLPAGAGIHPPPGARSNTDIEAGNDTTPISKEYTQLPPSSSGAKSSTPWYKTRTGIIGLVILAIIIIGAVVGGAVGGTQANKGNKSKNSAPISPSSSPSSSESTLGPSLSSSSAGTVATQAAGSGTGSAGAPDASETSSVVEQPTGAVTESTTTTSTAAGQGVGGGTGGIAIAAATRI